MPPAAAHSKPVPKRNPQTTRPKTGAPTPTTQLPARPAHYDYYTLPRARVWGPVSELCTPALLRVCPVRGTVYNDRGYTCDLTCRCRTCVRAPPWIPTCQPRCHGTMGWNFKIISFNFLTEIIRKGRIGRGWPGRGEGVVPSGWPTAMFLNSLLPSRPGLIFDPSEGAVLFQKFGNRGEPRKIYHCFKCFLLPSPDGGDDLS